MIKQVDLVQNDKYWARKYLRFFISVCMNVSLMVCHVEVRAHDYYYQKELFTLVNNQITLYET